MSCNFRSRIAATIGRTAAGVGSLASQRAFYAGVAVGAVGSEGLALAVRRFRRRRRWSRAGSFARTVAAPGSRSHPKPIPILDHGVDLRPGLADRRRQPRAIPGLPIRMDGTSTWPRPKPIPGIKAGAVETHLKPAPLQIQTRQGPRSVDGYRLLRPDGAGTGLAITPELIEGEGGRVQENKSGWMVSHANSGAAVAGPYRTVTEAQSLAGQLAHLPWTAEGLSPADLGQAKSIITNYQAGAASIGKPAAGEKRVVPDQ